MSSRHQLGLIMGIVWTGAGIVVVAAGARRFGLSSLEMDSDFLALTGVTATGLLGYFGKRYTDNVTAQTAERASQGELEVSWVKELRDEIAKLRSEVDELRGKVEQKGRIAGILADFLDELSAFVLYGQLGEYPIPPDGEASDHYNRSRWLTIKAMHDGTRKKDV